MIVQPTTNNKLFFIITLDSHLMLADQLAASFGNQEFSGLEPQELMRFIVRHHDVGWKEVDQLPAIVPKTGLPLNITEIPYSQALKIPPRSVAFNENHHLFCGLLVSMHYCGLYNGRYGVKKSLDLSTISTISRNQIEQFIHSEENRQQKLKDILKSCPITSPWIRKEHLFYNYYRLQFFDQLALYLNLNNPKNLKYHVIEHVPKKVGDYVDIHLEPVKPGVLKVFPFPFKNHPIQVISKGRYYKPTLADAKVIQQNLRNIEIVDQCFFLSRT
jgi:Protein of unknown function (DUF3891)